MAEYQRVRDWIDKNKDPEKYSTLEEFIQDLERSPGVSDKKGVIEDYKNANKDKFAFESKRELKDFDKKQKKYIDDLEKASSREEQKRILEDLQKEINGKLDKLEPSVEVSRPEPRPKENIVTKTVGRVGRFFKGLFGKK